MTEIIGWQNNPPTKDAARELLGLALEDKLIYTCANISGWDMFTDGKWYISFSGGKDSTVLLYIAARMLNQMPVQPHPLRVLFCDTGLEYPEIRRFVPWYIRWLAEQFPRVTIDYVRRRPEKNFFDIIHDHGYPVVSKEVANHVKKARNGSEVSASKLRGTWLKPDGTKSDYNCEKYQYLLEAPYLISPKCCDFTKEAPTLEYEKETGCSVVIATMALESMLRYKRWLESGCNVYEGKRPISKPMSFWTEQDVLRYIAQENIPICSVYGEVKFFDGGNYYDSALTEQSMRCTGCRRTGCIYCAFGAHLEREETRFQRLKRTHPKHWNYAINGGEWDRVDGMWKPSKTPGHVGLGMGRVLDYIGVAYE